MQLLLGRPRVRAVSALGVVATLVAIAAALMCCGSALASSQTHRLAVSQPNSTGIQGHRSTQRHWSPETLKRLARSDAAPFASPSGIDQSALIVEDSVDGGNGPGDYGDTTPDTNLQSMLEGYGYNVTVDTTLPADLSPYGTVWYVGVDPLNNDEQAELEAYVRSGRGLYLTGERLCCQALNDSDQAIVSALTGQSQISIGDGQDLDNQSLYENSVNASAIGGITTTPNVVSEWYPDAPGVISGAAPQNVLTEGYQNGTLVATSATWPGSELTSHRGNLVLMMDINWLEGDLDAGTPFVENIGQFLTAGVNPGNIGTSGAEYVALGDSYSSGEGNPLFYDGGAPNGCDRSEQGSYADMIAQHLGLSYQDPTNQASTQFRFVACSGATTGDLWSSPDRGAKGITPELDALGTNTRLVTVTVGGDDVHFADVLEECIGGTLLTARFLTGACDEDGYPAAAAFGNLRHASSNIAALENTLWLTYMQIRAKAPNARIYVLGYPDIFAHENFLNFGCPAASGMDSAANNWLTDLQTQLDAAVKQAADDAGVHYVDPNAPGPNWSFLGHDICAGDSWFHPLYQELLTRNYAFHPKVAGQQAMAQALEAAGATNVHLPQAAAAVAASEQRDSVRRDPKSLASQVTPDAQRSAADDLDGGGSISGTVTDASGNPLGNVAVDAYDTAGDFVTSTITADDGTYTLDDLAAGEYVLEFDPSGQNEVEQFSGGAADFSSATAITVGDSPVTGIDASLQAGATISGTVTDSQGNPLSGITVEAETSAGTVEGESTTASDGSYEIQGLAAGSYLASFAADGENYLNEFYGADDDNIDHATPVTVSAGGSASSLDQSLPAGGSVSGTVTDTNGNGIGGVEVNIVATDGSGNQASAFTGSDGTYSAVGLPAGTYSVSFDADGQPYLDQDDAQTITVTQGQANTDIDASLSGASSVSGTVTDANGNPLSGVQVIVASTDPNNPGAGGQTTTADDGTYTVSGLAAGSYSVEFDPEGQDDVDTFYDNEPNASSADAVTVPAATAVSGIDESLAAGATVSGTVTDSSGNPLSGVTVEVQAADGNGGQATTAADGTYSVGGLPADSYAVEFQASGQNDLTQDYQAPDGSTTLALAAGADDSGIDAQLTQGGAISGQVTDSQGDPLTGIEVDATTSDCSSGVGSAITDSSGDYTIAGLTAGTYDVEVNPQGGAFIDAPYSHPVTVTLGSTVQGINVSLGSSADGDADDIICSQAQVPLIWTAPQIQGTTTVGATLTETNGSWDNQPSGYSYVWEDCDASGANCTAIPGASSQTYPLASSDVGHTIRVIETATNPLGAGPPATSAPTAVVAAATMGTGSTGTGSTGTSHLISTKALRAALRRIMVPRRPAAALRNLIRRGVYKTRVSLPTTGHLALGWYVKEPTRSDHHKLERIGSMQIAVSAGRRFTLTLRLTKTGRHLLSAHGRVLITVQGRLTPRGSHPISATTRAVLRS
jgi:protocatechuate 3,4-dioxygenase beta subunit